MLIPLLAIAVFLLLVSEGLHWRPGVWIFKTLASLTFVAIAAGRSQGSGTYGVLIVLALVLSLIGDVLLIPKKTFVLGLAAFLFAHIAFSAAFLSREVDFVRAGIAGAMAAVAAFFAYRWLSPHVGKLRIPVIAYMLAITVMVALAFGVRTPLAIPTGAVLFFLSDLSVARDQFVKKSFGNKLWGLPFYYGAQFLFALSLL